MHFGTNTNRVGVLALPGTRFTVELYPRFSSCSIMFGGRKMWDKKLQKEIFQRDYLSEDDFSSLVNGQGRNELKRGPLYAYMTRDGGMTAIFNRGPEVFRYKLSPESVGHIFVLCKALNTLRGVVYPMPPEKEDEEPTDVARDEEPEAATAEALVDSLTGTTETENA